MKIKIFIPKSFGPLTKKIQTAANLLAFSLTAISMGLMASTTEAAVSNVKLYNALLSYRDSSSKNIAINVEVENIGADKKVVIVASGNGGKDWSEIPAIYNSAVSTTAELWKMNSFIMNTEKVIFKIKYNVNGQTYWDTNNGENYTIAPNINDSVKPRSIKLFDAKLTYRDSTTKYVDVNIEVDNLIGATKQVIILSTTNGGKTWSEIPASYNKPGSATTDIWTLKSFIRNDENAEFKLKYVVDGKNYWDTNYSQDYYIGKDYGDLVIGKTVQVDEFSYPPLKGVTQVTASWETSYALKSDGTVVGWGNNENNDVWNYRNEFDDIRIYRPVKMLGLNDVSKINVGFHTLVAIKKDGTVWGRNVSYGNNDTNYEQLRQLPNISSVIDADTSTFGSPGHTLFVKTDGTAWSVGANSNGQLGLGNNLSVSNPTKIQNLTNVKTVIATGNSSLALKNDGTVWAWGDNSRGQLGTGNKQDSSSPVQSKGLLNIVELKSSTFLYGTLLIARKADGTVWTWGGDVTTPKQVSGLTNVAAIAAGRLHYIAAKSDGTVWTWGGNASGQLGNGTTLDSVDPQQVMGISKVKKVGAGDSHSLAIREDGTVMAWGASGYGRLGNGSPESFKLTPVVVGADANLPFGMVEWDTQTPSIPLHLSVHSKTNTSVNLTWHTSKDDVGISRYEVYQNGALYNSTTTRVNNSSFAVTGLTPNQTYTFTVVSIDTDGNRSQTSSPVTVTTNALATVNPVAAVYYKLPTGWTQAYIHYRLNNAAWTNAPGIKMKPSEIPGYWKLDVDLGTTVGTAIAEAAFNNGYNTWDNNNQQNYKMMYVGYSTIENGILSGGTPLR